MTDDEDWRGGTSGLDRIQRIGWVRRQQRLFRHPATARAYRALRNLVITPIQLEPVGSPQQHIATNPLDATRRSRAARYSSCMAGVSASSMNQFSSHSSTTRKAPSRRAVRLRQPAARAMPVQVGLVAGHAQAHVGPDQRVEAAQLHRTRLVGRERGACRRRDLDVDLRAFAGRHDEGARGGGERERPAPPDLGQHGGDVLGVAGGKSRRGTASLVSHEAMDRSGGSRQSRVRPAGSWQFGPEGARLGG